MYTFTTTNCLIL